MLIFFALSSHFGSNIGPYSCLKKKNFIGRIQEYMEITAHA